MCTYYQSLSTQIDLILMCLQLTLHVHSGDFSTILDIKQVIIDCQPKTFLTQVLREMFLID